MKLAKEQCHSLGVALNEATLLGIEANIETRQVGVTFAVLTLPESGPAPKDSRVQLVFDSVSRIAASLRHGHWDDRAAKVQPFTIQELLSISQDFREPIFGWEFFNLDQSRFYWLDRLSLDWRSKDRESQNTFLVSQSLCIDRVLNACIWFDKLTVYKPDGDEISLEEFNAGGKRWWDAFYGNDKRTDGHGLFPLK